MATSTSQSSRFSSLRVFRFPSKAEPLPPPPPPKDPYYLGNRSLASLSPSSFPGSPLAAQYAKTTSPAPFQSTMSLVSTVTTLSPTSAEPTGKAKRERSIFKFGRRSTKNSQQTQSPTSSLMPTEPTEQSAEFTNDDGISLPWNVQHHTHVDEALVGLPPSWSASLSEAGFTEDEIAAIRARRNASRSHPSPSSANYDTPFSPPSVLTNPTPRSTSLPRHLKDSSPKPSHTRLPLPFSPAGSRASSLGHLSTDSKVSHSPCATLDISREASTQYREIWKSHDKQGSVSSWSSNHTRSRTSSLSASAKDFPAPRTTAPKRVLQVVNTSPPSPPSAYNLSEKVNAPLDSKRTHKSTNSGSRSTENSTRHTPHASVEGSAESVHSSGSKASSKKLTGPPPRLSLRDSSGDISSWSQALLSVLPSPSDLPPNPPPRDTPESAPDSTSLHRSTSTKSDKSAGSNKPLPAIVLPEYEDDEGSASPTRTPLWDEILGMVQEASPSSFSPALNETLSPTLPTSPTESEQRFNIDSYMTVSGTNHDHSVDESMLTVEDQEYASNRDSGTSTMSTATVTAATIVKNVSVAKRATANYFHPLQVKEDDGLGDATAQSLSVASSVDLDSPMSSNFSSSSGSGSGSSSLPSQDQEQEQRLDVNGASLQPPVYLDLLDSPIRSEVNSGGPSPVLSETGTFGLGEKEVAEKKLQLQATLVNGLPTPVTPSPRYRGWLSEVVAPLESFIDHHTDPREHFVDLQEVAEGESGSVYAARVVNAQKLKNPIATTSENREETFVAIKNVPILPSGSTKLNDLQRELTLMKGVKNEYVLGMDALYVDLVEDSLWIRMALMERSLADVVALVEDGLMVQERMTARFCSDVLLALEYLQEQGIAHRDLRSDNLLLNTAGVLKIADFSNAVRVTAESPIRSEITGVIYWQAPEIRSGSYNALKVDVWSLGATAWETSQAKPPFADFTDPRKIGDRWPPLSQPEVYSRSFHEFLRLCSEPASSRPDPADLSETAFIRNACGRPVIIQLLSQCRAIEENAPRSG